MGIAIFHYRQQLAIFRYQVTRPTTLPTASAPVTTTPAPIIETPTSMPLQPTPIPAELNLAVPFTSQAPNGNWDTAHEEYCEEASALMADRYFEQTPIGTKDEADSALTALANWETAHLGFFESTTAAQTKQMIEANFPLNVTLTTTVDATTIKRALTDNQLVLVPSAGRKLGNPYFTAPGPVYHMLVIKGFTKDGKFITNDPGTRHGADYVYDEQTLLNAVGDWNNGNPATGQKVILIVSM